MTVLVKHVNIGSTVFTILRVLERHRHTEVMMVLCGACIFEQE